MVMLLPGVLRRPTASAITQVFWLLEKKPTALHFIQDVGEPKWCTLAPCDSQGKKLTAVDVIHVPSAWLDPDLCLSAELSSAERSQQLLAHLLRQRNTENDSHSLSVRVPVLFCPIPTLSLLGSLRGVTCSRQRSRCCSGHCLPGAITRHPSRERFRF